MKNFIVLIALISTSFLAHAQTYVNYNLLSNSAGSIGTIDATLNSNSEVAGSPFLFENWENTAVLYIPNSGKVLTNNINFNIEKSEFTSIISETSVFIFENLDKVEVNDKVFVKLKNKYYQSLVTSNDGMLLKEYTVKIEPKRHIITSTVIGPGKYEKGSVYFYYKNGMLNKLPLRKKTIIKVLISEKTAIINYVKEHKLSYSNEKDVIKIFNFYKSLK